MRERVEDLGRLLVMIDDILDNPLFRNSVYQKEMAAHLMSRAALENEDNEMFVERASDLEDLIRTVKHRLYDCLEIAKGEDYLNNEDGL